MHQACILARRAPCVGDELQVADGLVQGVDAALVQQLPHNLVGHLRTSSSTSKGAQVDYIKHVAVQGAFVQYS